MKGTIKRTVNSGPTRIVRRGNKRPIGKHVRVLAVAVVMALLVTSLPASSSTKPQTIPRAQENRSLPAQLYRSVSETVASVGSWVTTFIGTKSSSNSNAYQPVAAYIMPAPPFIDAPTSLTVTAASSSSISLSWTAPSGTVDHYEVERSTNLLGPFVFIANASGTTHNDSTVSSQHAYLYRVRAVASGGLPSAPSNMALGTAMSFEFTNLQGQQIRAQHFYDVRTAINAVRPVANLTPESWDRSTLAGLDVKADDVNEMRSALDAALTALSITVTPYQDPTLSVGANGTLIKGIHIEQLQTRSTRGSSSSSGPIDSDSSTARLDPLNETGGGGENPLSRNFNWNLPLVDLPGRAGMNLGLTLSYNSLVWTKINSNSISFDLDNGFPGPGFRLGFPVIQSLYYNTQVGKQAYLLIIPDGSRVELRQVGPSLYEAANSSHLLLDSSTMILRTTDGTQLKYSPYGAEFQCTEIKDRNGNYITVSYTAAGRINTVTDTLNRVITFNYDTNGWLTSITQVWNQSSTPLTHYWARFEYSNTTIDTSFPGMTIYGPADNSIVKTLSKVTLADDSHFDFSYTSWGQVWKVTSFAADNSVLNYRTYDLPQTGSPAHEDCPRFMVRKDWAKYWNGDTDGTTAASEEVATASFIIPASDSWTMPEESQAVDGMRAQVTSADGTVNKFYYIGVAGTSSGWRRGLLALVETQSGGTWRRKVSTTWTQDNTSVAYPINPRVLETNVYDPEGNRARTEITYQQFPLPNDLSCHLPRDVYEYASNASTILRSTRTSYNMSDPYKDRRILGLVSQKELYEGNTTGTLKSKVEFFYDNENASSSIQGTDQPVQHDNTYYGASFVTGRANLSSVKRHNVDNGQSTTTRTKYNTAGAVVSAKDASDHESTVSYTDSFSDGNNSRNTLAYPTTMTDPDGYSSTSKYHFDFGVVTRQQTPQPNVTTNTPGPEQSFAFDSIGRLQQVTNLVNNAYTRFEYPTSTIRIDSYTTIQAGLGEAHSFQLRDGAGRVVATAQDHPDSVGGFSGQKIIYDVMGRVFKTSNPTETSASGHPSQWNTAGDDAAAGWLYTEQTYDWKGRPLRTTHPDTKYKEAAYSGCGCAGGEVVTLTDEGTLDGGVEKRRQQKIYSDVLGRTFKLELYNWQGGTVYSTTVSTYNARNQITQIRQYAGAEGSGTYQDTTSTYDGYGRLLSKHRPEQDIGTATTYAYNADDTVLSVTDARGAAATYAYNGRHLTTGITYTASGSISVPAPVTYSYDAAGNRSWMNENSIRRVTYHYNMLSLMDWEDREFPSLSGVYRLSYDYNLGGQLKSITDPTNSSINYSYDRAGRVTSVSGTPYGTGGINGTPYFEISQYASNLKYRAWGALRSLTYGNQMTLNQEFDQRLRLTNFLVGGMTPPSYAPPGWETRLLSLSFQYYADGNLRGALVNVGNIMDRAYSYDHAGRAKEAYSGSEALDFLNGTNSGPPTGTYRQSYQFNAFDNMTGRTNRFWSQTDTFSHTYVNNRRQEVGVSYDADGNLTQDTDLQYTYDAAGRSASIFNAANNKTISPIYDGDGQVVNRNETEGGSTSLNFFQLRSTVMAGKVITELDSQGQKRKGFVYVNGQLLARQEHLWIVWQHDNPFTGTTAASNRDGAGSIDVDPDPMGVDLGSVDPYIEPELWEPPPEGMVGLLPGSGIPSGRCTLDGMAIECREAGHLLHIGAAEFEHPTAVWDNGGWHFVRFNRESGQYEARVFSHYENTGILTVGTRVSMFWQPAFRTITVSSSLNTLIGLMPWQDRVGPTPVPSEVWSAPPDAQGIRSNLDTMLKTGECGKFIDELLNRLSTTKNPRIAGSALDLFDMVTSQKGLIRGGLATKNKVGATIDGHLIRDKGKKPGNASIHIGTGFVLPPSPPEARVAAVNALDAFQVLHEVVHLAGQKDYYDDRRVAQVLSDWLQVPGLPNRKDYKSDQEFIGANSEYFSTILRTKCPPVPGSPPK